MRIPDDENSRTRRILPFVGGIVIGLVAVVLALFWLTRPDATPRTDAAEEPSATTPSSEEPQPETATDVASEWQEWKREANGPAERQIELVLLDPKSGDWRTARQIMAIPDDEAGRVKRIVGAWLDAARRERYRSLLGADVRLVSAFVSPSQRAYLNFSAASSSALPGGLAVEMELLAGLAKTLQANFPTLTQMQVLLNGQPTETLAGQLDISMPLQIAFFAGQGE